MVVPRLFLVNYIGFSLAVSKLNMNEALDVFLLTRRVSMLSRVGTEWYRQAIVDAGLWHFSRRSVSVVFGCSATAVLLHLILKLQ